MKFSDSKGFDLRSPPLRVAPPIWKVFGGLPPTNDPSEPASHSKFGLSMYPPWLCAGFHPLCVTCDNLETCQTVQALPKNRVRTRRDTRAHSLYFPATSHASGGREHPTTLIGHIGGQKPHYPRGRRVGAYLTPHKHPFLEGCPWEKRVCSCRRLLSMSTARLPTCGEVHGKDADGSG